MTTGMNFWDSSTWSFILAVTLLFGAMLAANMLRNLIKPLRTLMIPSSVLGGFLILLVDFVVNQATGTSLFKPQVLEMLTYHGLGLGFVAMSLRTADKKRDKYMKAGGLNAGVTVVSSYLLQGILGLLISIPLYYLLGSFFGSGLLLPMGYGQGPGQAYNWGRTYENLFGFANGTSFGLTVAAMGFVSASIGGVIYLNILRRKGKFTGDIGSRILHDELTPEMVNGKDEIPMMESMDKFTVQVSLVFVAYLLAYLFMSGIDSIIRSGALGDFGYNTIRPLVWGFNFLFGTIFALILKAALGGLRKGGVIRREYMNNFMQNRIAGFMFDLMVVASIAAIDLSAFTYKEFVVPLVLICFLGAVLTYWYLIIVCKRIFPKYEHEAFLSLYGNLTGTASTGVILMREVDPKFETQAADNLVYHQPWAILFGFPMLLLLSFSPQSVTKSILTLIILSVLFCLMNVILFRGRIFQKKKSGEEPQ